MTVKSAEFSRSGTFKLRGPAGCVTSEDGQVVAALGPHSDRHALVVASHQPVQEAPGLLGNALFALVDGTSTLDGLAPVVTEADLADHALKQLGHVVLQRRRRLDELAVKHHSASSALWGNKHTHNAINKKKIMCWLRKIGCCTGGPLTLTLHSDLSGPDQVTLIAHEDDGNVFCLSDASQGDAELGSGVEAGAVGHGIHNNVRVPNLQTVFLRGATATAAPTFLTGGQRRQVT